MTAPVRAQRRGPAAAPPASPPPVTAALPWPVLLRLPLRLLRRGAALLCLAVAVYVAVEVVSYRSTYDEASARESLSRLADNPTVRVLQGVPRNVETVGGFVVWDAGWFLALVVSVWALLTTTRLLRGEEDAARADLLLAGPVPATRQVLAHVAVVLLGALACGATVALTMVALGLPATGAVLFGAALAGTGATAAALAAVTSQLLDVRRRALGAAGAVLGLLFVVRMVGSADADQEGLLRLTPFGWLSRVAAFADDSPAELLPFAVVPALLLVLATRERRRRDTGAAAFAGRDTRAPRLRLLGSPAGFLWRSGRGVLLAWAVGGALYGVVTGSLVEPVVELVTEDEEYRRVLEQMGMDLSSPVEGYLALMAAALMLVYAFYVAWRVGSLRSEEASGRLDLLLVRPVARTPLVLVAAAQTVVAAALVTTATGLGVWAGAALTGAELSAGQAVWPLWQSLPVLVLFTGLGVLALGVLPRLTVAVPAVLAVVGYLAEVLGSALDLPRWVVDLSPFGHLPPLPGAGYPWVAACLLTGSGLLATVLGARAFARRDLLPD